MPKPATTEKVNPMKIGDYKVGDELFRYVTCGGVFRYVVIGRRERPDEVQLEVECKTCTHGWQCQLLLAQDDYGHIVTVHMLNNNDDNDQRIWHGNEAGLHFCATPEQAKAEKTAKMVSETEDRLRKAKEEVASLTKRLADFRGLAEGVQP